MNRFRLSDLMEGFDSKYSLIVVAAKRARQLTEESGSELHAKRQNSVSVAMREIAEGKVEWERVLG